MLKNNKRTIILTSIIILLPIIAGIMLWDKLPDRMATKFHFDDGYVGYSSKIFTVFGINIFLLIMHLFCAFLTATDPKRKNISNKVYTIILWICPIVSLLTGGFIYSYNMGLNLNFRFIIILFIGILCIFLGNYFPKIRQNYTMGIRLPWTLANEENWNKTHRLGGIVWIIAGVMILMLLPMLSVKFINEEYAICIIIVSASLIPGIYSLMLHVFKGL